MYAYDKYLHIPIQIITCTDTDGHITPIRFRYQDAKEGILTVPVDEIVSYRENMMDTVIRVYAHLYENHRQLIEITYHHGLRKWYIDWVKD